MKAQLFIDSLRAITSNFQAFTIKLITRNTPLSHKIQDLSLTILSFKSELLTNLCRLFNESQKFGIYNKFQQQLQQNTKKLKKLQLHALLRKKIKRLQKQSMISSIVQQSFNSSFVQDPAISKLKNSMILIEKDLGINQQVDQYHEEVSGVVHKSMLSLQMTPIKTDNSLDMSNTSMRIQSQYVLPENHDKNIQQKIQYSKKQAIKNDTKNTATKIQTKKKKTTVYSNKGGMFDNLLQQSLQSYISGPQKV